MDLALGGFTTVVTGAGSGIGRASALALAREGASVGLIDRDGDAVAGVADEITTSGGRALAVAADVTDEHALTAAVRTIATRFSPATTPPVIDAVIGCAGVSGPIGDEVSSIGLDEWNQVFAVNVTGQFLLTKATLPFLTRSGEASVVFIASDSALVAAPGMVPYCASKGALVQLARALAVELAPRGIRVNAVCPSIVDTPMSRSDLSLETTGFDGASFPVQTPEEVARHVLYLASECSRPVNGTVLVSDFGYSARSAFPA